MKELTIEEKAQAYDEAIKRAKELLEIGLKDTRDKRVVLSFFPELKESEDERIREELIELIGCMHDADPRKGAWLAWLEKQKEFVSADFDDVWETADCDELTAPLDKYSKDAIKEMCHAWYDKGIELERKSWLEKQGEQKPQGKSAVEAVKEEKVDNQNCVNPTDKVKPKFHEGDWVIDKHGIVHQIDKVVENVTNHTCAYDIVGGGYFNDNTEGVRLWTIQDAKDGDVLATKAGGIFIYKELLYDKPFAYCGVDKFGVFKDCNCGNGLDWTPYLSNVTPAIKEQRDLLFQKMKEAGYEWDAEKKELKKIGNEIGEIEIPFGAKDSELQEVTYYIPKGFHVEIDDDKVVIKKGEKPTAWSEEDEYMLECALDMVKWYIGRKETKCRSVSNWLKSLKQRIGG